MFRRSALALISVIALSGGLAMGQSAISDDAAVRQMLEGYIGAWKQADPDLIAANFTDDGDFINPTGFHATGHATISAFYAHAFAAGYRGSDAGFTARKTRQISPGVILIDGEWYISSAHKSDGKQIPDERGLASAVLVKTDIGWRIAALREQSSGTTISPE